MEVVSKKLISSVPAAPPESSVAILPLTVLQDPAPAGATFHSNVPRTGANAHGLWLAVQGTETVLGGYGATWSLYRSTDNGASWSLYYQSPSYDGPPPSLHADRNDEVWVFQPTYAARVDVHRIRPATGQHNVYSFDAESSTKHTSIYHLAWQAFYYMGQHGDFIVFDPVSTQVTRRALMFGAGMGYPHMAVSGARLVVGATIAGDGNPRHYVGCVAAISDDAGNTMKSAAGDVLTMPVPLVASGGLISFVPGALENQDPWLHSLTMLPGTNAVLGIYHTSTTGLHRAVGISIFPSPPNQLVVYNETMGDETATVYDGSGVFVRDGTDLYYISGGLVPGISGRAIVAAKWTGGSTWRIVARTEIGFNDYAVAGPRQRAPGQPIVITVTDQRSPDRSNQRVLVLTFNP